MHLSVSLVLCVRDSVLTHTRSSSLYSYSHNVMESSIFGLVFDVGVVTRKHLLIVIWMLCKIKSEKKTENKSKFKKQWTVSSCSLANDPGTIYISLLKQQECFGTSVNLKQSRPCWCKRLFISKTISSGYTWCVTFKAFLDHSMHTHKLSWCLTFKAFVVHYVHINTTNNNKSCLGRSSKYAVRSKPQRRCLLNLNVQSVWNLNRPCPHTHREHQWGSQHGGGRQGPSWSGVYGWGPKGHQL